MAKRKITDNDAGERVVRRSTRGKAAVKEEPVHEEEKPVKMAKTATKAKAVKDEEGGEKTKPKTTPAKPAAPAAAVAKPEEGNNGERQYWLMKAEPESRLEKGHDVKFSIDDLASKTEPEAWDGIRNYAARNNLRAMRKGDLAFFYHSSCKVPAIVGIMEIVAEHSPDLTAQDPRAAYHDPKDTDPSNPRWSVVHVEFREKFKEPLTLHELKGMQGKCEEISGLQLLRLGRLSVCKVEREEWEFLMGVIRGKEGGGKEEE